MLCCASTSPALLKTRMSLRPVKIKFVGHGVLFCPMLEYRRLARFAWSPYLTVSEWVSECTFLTANRHVNCHFWQCYVIVGSDESINSSVLWWCWLGEKKGILAIEDFLQHRYYQGATGQPGFTWKMAALYVFLVYVQLHVFLTSDKILSIFRPKRRNLPKYPQRHHWLHFIKETDLYHQSQSVIGMI